MIPLLGYWQAVAKGIDAENEKASLFTEHSHSLGIIREAILRDLIIRQTPEPLRVHTGFVCRFTAGKILSSRQCDVLVYDPGQAQPYYRIDELCVVPQDAAKLVVEVKTTLNKKGLEEIAGVAKSVRWMGPPVLGFAYSGRSLRSVLKNLQRLVVAFPKGTPDVLAVHTRNYFIYRLNRMDEGRSPYTALDFSPLGEVGRGLATALFLEACKTYLGWSGIRPPSQELYVQLGDGAKKVQQLVAYPDGSLTTATWEMKPIG